MRIFGRVQPKSEFIFTFLYNFMFKPYHLSRPLVPFREEIRICPRRLFCPKFDVEKLLFEAFLGIMRIFGSVWPKSECIFPFLYNFIFKPYHLSSPLTPLGGEGERTNMPLRSFFIQNSMPKNFCLNLFLG